MFTKLNNAIDNGLIFQVFTHIRNYLICMTLIIAGFFALESQYQVFFGLIIDEFAAGIVIFLGFMLALLNLYDAIYRLSKTKFHILLHIFLISIYMIITVRVLEIVWHFKSSL
jgi:hypothetical protein